MIEVVQSRRVPPDCGLHVVESAHFLDGANMHFGRLRSYDLLLWGAACVRETQSRLEVFDLDQWYRDPVPVSKATGIEYDSSTGTLFEVGLRLFSLNSGEAIGSIDFYLRGHNLTTGEITIEAQNGTAYFDQFLGEYLSAATAPLMNPVLETAAVMVSREQFHAPSWPRKPYGAPIRSFAGEFSANL